MHVERFAQACVPAVQAFNARLKAGGWDGFGLPEALNDHPDAARSAGGIRKTHFVVVDGGDIRGGFLLQRQPFWLADHQYDVANYQAPLSEGLTCRRYAHVAAVMIRHVLRENSLTFAVGMGSADQPLPRMLRSMGWRIVPIPFLFKLQHPGRCFAQIRRFRTHTSARVIATLARITGLGWVGTRLYETWSSGVWRPRGVRLRAIPLRRWEPWVDEVWLSARSNCSMVGVRNTTTLEDLYPSHGREIRLCLEDAGRPIGWAVILDTEMRGDRHFGDLRVGTVVDCLTMRGYEQSAATAIARVFEERQVDLVITNQSHDQWIAAFRRAGFLAGPSNYLLATSKAMTELVSHPDATARIHLTRGDGDGRIHL